MRPTVLAIGDVVGCTLSAILLVRGYLAYPLLTIAVLMPAAVVAALVIGFWFGGYGRIHPTVALAVGSGAVLAGFGGYITALSLFSASAAIAATGFRAGALAMVSGYAILAATAARPLFRAWSRQS